MPEIKWMRRVTEECLRPKNKTKKTKAADGEAGLREGRGWIEKERRESGANALADNMGRSN